MSAESAKKFTKSISKKLDICWSYIICRSFSGWGAQFCCCSWRTCPEKAANNEVFTLTQKILDQKRRENHFIDVNEAENVTNAKGVVSEYTPSDTSLEKLRRKYTTLKAEWRKISDRCKNGSGLALEKEPSWYKILNPIFSEKNESLHLAEGSEDLSFNLQNGSIDSNFEGQLTDDENSFQRSDEESLNEEGEQMSFEEPPRKPPLVLTKKTGGCSWQKKKRSIAKSNPFKNC